MRAQSLTRTSLGVIVMGAAALITTPEAALAACRAACIDECMAHPDLYCESYNCSGEGATCSSTSVCEEGYKISCNSEAN